MNNLLEKFLVGLLGSATKQMTTNAVLMAGSMMLYAFGGLLFVEKQYTLAILCVVSGYCMLYIRELLKVIIEKHGKRTKKS